MPSTPIAGKSCDRVIEALALALFCAVISYYVCRWAAGKFGRWHNSSLWSAWQSQPNAEEATVQYSTLEASHSGGFGGSEVPPQSSDAAPQTSDDKPGPSRTANAVAANLENWYRFDAT